MNFNKTESEIKNITENINVVVIFSGALLAIGDDLL